MRNRAWPQMNRENAGRRNRSQSSAERRGQGCSRLLMPPRFELRPGCALLTVAAWGHAAYRNRALVVIVVRVQSEAAEQAMAFVAGAGGEVKGAGISGSAAVANGQTPEAFNSEFPLVVAFEQTLEFSARIEGHDGAAAEVADEQRVGVFPEVGRRNGQTPGRVKLMDVAAGIRTAGEAAEHEGRWIERVNEAVTWTGNVIVLRRILFGEGDEDNAANILHVERGVTHRTAEIRELSGEDEIGAVHVN